MKQVLQNLKDGSVEVLDVPAPMAEAGFVLVRVAASLVSAGTERAAVEFGRQNLLQKARSKPHLVHQVAEKVVRDGVVETFQTVKNRLNSMNVLGYSCAGVVVATGQGVAHVKSGDLVACAGAGYASHAEYVVVPKNLVVRIPNDDPALLEDAAFSTLGAIALQGIRLGNPQLGEVVGLIGLGLLGQITLQLLQAAGCMVIGYDLNSSRVERARELGVSSAFTEREAFVAASTGETTGFGVDMTLIAAATSSNEPVELAGVVTRSKGKVVAVGEVGLMIPRRLYYQKELELIVSRSYGPGRYDPDYEEHGHDYPYPYVRWTEQRNMQAFVNLLSRGRLRMQPLITHRFPVDKAPSAYDLITGKTNESFLGVLITYPGNTPLVRRVGIGTDKAIAPTSSSRERIGLGVVGAGGFVTSTLLPAFKKSQEIELIGVVNRSGVSAHNVAQRFGFRYAASDMDDLLSDSAVLLLLIGTPHYLHAPHAQAALLAGKHVFVEKPLCLTFDELQRLEKTLDASPGKMLMVGFNRRFAPLAIKLKEVLCDRREPLVVHYRVNAGYLPSDHWTQNPSVGGGRLLGEGCHFLDWMLWLVNSPVIDVHTTVMDDASRYSTDNFVTQLRFADGSLGTLTYVANGSRQSGKERIEVFCSGHTLVLHDFKRIEVSRPGRLRSETHKLRTGGKGHAEECHLIVNSLHTGAPPPIPISDIMHSTRITLMAYRSMKLGTPIQIDASST